MRLLKPSWVAHDGHPVFSVDIHPDGSRFATGGQGVDTGRIVVWNMAPVMNEDDETNKNVPKLLCQMDNHLACVNCVRWSCNGKYLASGGDDKVVMIWQTVRYGSGSFGTGGKVANVEQWRCTNTLRGHSGDVLDLSWSPHDAWLASCSVDNTIVIWNCLKWQEIIAILKGHTGLVKGVSWDPVGKYVASQSDDKTLRVWRTHDWQQEALIEEPFQECGGTTHVLRLSWSPNGQFLVSAHAMNNSGPTAQIIEREGWKTNKDFVGHRKAITCVRFNPNILTNVNNETGKSSPFCCCAIGSRDRSLSIWKTCLKRPLVVVHDLFSNSILDIAWTRTGYHLLVCSSDGTVAYVDFTEDEIGQPISGEERILLYQRLYGKNLPLNNQNVSPSTLIIENPGMLKLQEEQQKQEKLAKESIVNSTVNDVNCVAKGPELALTPTRQCIQIKGPTDKQIETRMPDGRRRITPLFIPPTPDVMDGPLPFNSQGVTTFSSSSETKSKIVIEKRDESMGVTSRLSTGSSAPTAVITTATAVTTTAVVATTAAAAASVVVSATAVATVGTGGTTATTAVATVPVVTVGATAVSSGTSAVQSPAVGAVIGESPAPATSLIPTSHDGVTPKSSAPDISTPEKQKPVATPPILAVADKPTQPAAIPTAVVTPDKQKSVAAMPPVLVAVDMSMPTAASPSTALAADKQKPPTLTPATVIVTDTQKHLTVTPSPVLVAEKPKLPAAVPFAEPEKPKETPPPVLKAVPTFDATPIPVPLKRKVDVTSGPGRPPEKRKPGRPPSAAKALLAAKEARVERPTHTPATVHLPALKIEKSSSVQISNVKGENMSIEVENAVTSMGSIPIHRVRCSSGGNVLWESLLSSRAAGVAGSRHLACLVCEDATLTVFTLAGRRMSPPIILSAPATRLNCNGFYVLVITSRGHVSVWDMQRFQIIVKNESLLPVMQGETDLTIRSTGLTEGGAPLISLSTGKSYVFGSELGAWLQVTNGDDILNHCSDYRACLPPHEVFNGTSLPLAALQGQVCRPTRYARNMFLESPSMVQAGTLSHLDNQLVASLALHSGKEYKFWLLTSVRYLAQEGLENRLREICSSLLGPIPPGGKNSRWEPNVLGMHKHDLLQEVLPIIASNLRLQRLVTEYKDQLDITNSF